jgi:hypothetical protein
VVAVYENVSGNGSVVGGVVAPEVQEVDGEAYEVCRSSGKMCVWSSISGLASYGGSGRTEGLQVAETFGELGGICCYEKQRREGMRGCKKQIEIDGERKGILGLSVPDKIIAGGWTDGGASA